MKKMMTGALALCLMASGGVVMADSMQNGSMSMEKGSMSMEKDSVGKGGMEKDHKMTMKKHGRKKHKAKEGGMMEQNSGKMDSGMSK